MHVESLLNADFMMAVFTVGACVTPGVGVDVLWEVIMIVNLISDIGFVPDVLTMEVLSWCVYEQGQTPSAEEEPPIPTPTPYATRHPPHPGVPHVGTETQYTRGHKVGGGGGHT